MIMMCSPESEAISLIPRHLFFKEEVTMKKYYVILATTVAALMALSCQKNESELKENTPEAPRYMKCVLATPECESDTKISLNYSTGKTEWIAGDQILVHGAGSSNMKTVTLTAGDISADGKTATIDVSDITPYDRSDKGYDSQLYASYPASLVPQSKNLYYNSAFVGALNNEPLMAGCDDASHNTFYFFHLTGAMTFTIDGDFDGYILVGNGGTETVGYTTLGSRIAHKNDDSFYIKRVYDVDYYTSVPITSISGSLVADGSTLNKIFFPGGVTLSSGFTMYLTKGGDIQKFVKTTKAVSIGCGEILPIGEIPSGKIQTYVAPSNHDATNPAIAGAIDLGGTSAGTANCYMIDGSDDSKANTVFKFKAVKGNTSVNVGTIASVEVLWETYNTSDAVTAKSVIAAVDFDKQDANDYYEICFKTPETLHTGNALIAAKNSGGQILWSWHIWIPASAVTANAYGLEGQTWMDRNLGALTVTEDSDATVAASSSFGLLYSWGRKDPFPGLASFDSSSLITTTGTFDLSGPLMTVAEAHAHPMTFVKTGSDSNYLWTTDDPTGLWATDKTVNDPCPPGYVVPQFKDGEGLWKNASATGFAVDATHKWFKMGSGSFFVGPIVGFLDACQSTPYHRERGSRTLIWSSTNTSTTGLSYALRVNSGGTAKIEWERQCRGFSVRCVAE